MVLFFVKHSSSSRNPKSVSQKVGGNHWNEPWRKTDLPLARPPAPMLPQPGRSETRRDGGHVGFLHVKLTKVYQNFIEVQKKQVPQGTFYLFKTSIKSQKTGDTSIPQVTLRFMACFRVFVLRSGPLTSSSSSGSVWALGPADYIAEASSVHVKDEDVENNQCDIKIWFFKHREHFKEQIQIIATGKWINIQRFTPPLSFPVTINGCYQCLWCPLLAVSLPQAPKSTQPVKLDLPQDCKVKRSKKQKQHWHHKIWAQNFSVDFLPVSCFGPCGTQPQHLAPCRNRAPLRHPVVAPQPWHPQIAPNHGTHTQAWHPAATSRGPFFPPKEQGKRWVLLQWALCCSSSQAPLAIRPWQNLQRCFSFST